MATKYFIYTYNAGLYNPVLKKFIFYPTNKYLKKKRSLKSVIFKIKGVNV